jgi:nitrite reductase/ring-hydroxylating ferredoxin subunit/uncharacterized membrane protein
MRSTAHIKGHPIHPALIPFPFAFLSGAWVFDALGWWLDRPGWSAIGAHLSLAGIATALVAAVPGFIDYLNTVPPDSTAKARATKHMLANLTAVGLFAAGWWFRSDAMAQPSALIPGIELVAVGLLVAAGWMGGTLVYRNQIGVDHRYAQAGKWHDETVEAVKGAARVAAKEELQENQMKLLRVNGERIVLGRTEDAYVAFGDRCTHRGGSLADGTMICGTVQCPWHGSQFDVQTGDVKAGPAKKKIKTYTVEQDKDDVRLTV